MDEKRKNRVLVCPLGWGLGHASRLIPIIRRLQKSGFEVIAAGDDLQMQYISSCFPDLITIHFPSFKVKLSKGSNQLFPIIGVALRLPYHTVREHYAIKRIVKDNNIKLIISDNRYGLWCSGIKSILITHQLWILFPKPFRFLEPIGAWFIRLISQKFTYCWVPDYLGAENLAGKLSHPLKLPINSRFIGVLSRFQDFKADTNSPKWDMVVVASGPSPQREIFIDLIVVIAKRTNLKTLIVKGNPVEGVNIYEDNGIFYAGHLTDNDFANAILSSKYLITRAGYSTIMDLSVLGVSGLIVSTPGQTEQEYLAKNLSSKGSFRSCKQDELVKIDISIAKVVRTSICCSNDFLGKEILGTII